MTGTNTTSRVCSFGEICGWFHASMISGQNSLALATITIKLTKETMCGDKWTIFCLYTIYSTTNNLFVILQLIKYQELCNQANQAYFYNPPI